VIKRIICIATFLCQLQWAKAQSTYFDVYQQKLPGAELSFRMVPIKSGSFTMGNAKGAADEKPVKNITVSAFWMGAYEVTRDELDVFLKDENTSQNNDVDAITRPSPQYVDLTWGMGKEGGYPANSMSQRTALMYCRWLYKKTGIFYRLPTEAEWEYACRAGTTTTYYFGNDAAQLGDYAWYAKNSDDKYQKVGQKKPNAWGLYDMLGNLMEWTLDHYDAAAYSRMPEKNPMQDANPVIYPKSLRGGNFTSEADELNCSRRFHSDPEWNKRDPQIPQSKWWLTEARWVGFRVLRPLQQPDPAAAEKFYQQYLN
jgi:formylglycine-generating enzyme required for sulfatase activity